MALAGCGWGCRSCSSTGAQPDNLHHQLHRRCKARQAASVRATQCSTTGAWAKSHSPTAKTDPEIV
eukprot:2503025-Amphidinium_carterae.1